MMTTRRDLTYKSRCMGFANALYVFKRGIKDHRTII